MSAAVAMLATALHGVPAAAQTVVVQGSTTFNSRLLEPHREAIATKAGVNLQVIPNKSLNGLIALLEGRADLAMISAPLQAEIAALREKGNWSALEQLQEHQISQTRVAFAVHPTNPVRSASLEVLTAILTGKIGNWRALGGPDLPIRVAFVASSGGVTQTVQAQLLGGQPISAGQVIPLASPEQVVKVVEQEPGALGLAQLGLTARRNLPELATEKRIEQVLVLVTLGQPKPAVSRVIDATRRVAQERLASMQH